MSKQAQAVKIYDTDFFINLINDMAHKKNINTETLNNNIPKFDFLLSQIGYKFKEQNYFILKNSNTTNLEYTNTGFINIDTMYNYPLIMTYINIFIDICNYYNIIPSYNLFFSFIGSNELHINKWLNNEKLSQQDIRQLEKIGLKRKFAIDDKLANSSQIVGQITLHNDQYQQQRFETINKALDVAKLPDLSTTGAQMAQIASDL